MSSEGGDVRIPTARPRWVSWIFFRVCDLFVAPALCALRILLRGLSRESGFRLARTFGLFIAKRFSLSVFRRNLRALEAQGFHVPEKTEQVVAESTIHQLRNVVDIVKVLDQRAIPLGDLVVAVGEEHLKTALESGRGVVLISSHTGNWELSAAWLAWRGYPFNVVYYEQPSRVLDRYFQRVRRGFGVKILPQRRGLKAAFRALRGNEVLAIMADQDGTASGIFTDFFGFFVSMPRGAVRLALRQQCPLVHTYNHRLPDGRYRQVFFPPRWPPPQHTVDGERILAEQILSEIEEIVRLDPAQWLISYDRFKLRHLSRLKELDLVDRVLAEQRWIEGWQTRESQRQ